MRFYLIRHLGNAVGKRTSHQWLGATTMNLDKKVPTRTTPKESRGAATAPEPRPAGQQDASVYEETGHAEVVHAYRTVTILQRTPHQPEVTYS